MHTAIAAGIACELNQVKDRLNCKHSGPVSEEDKPVGGARPVTEAGFSPTSTSTRCTVCICGPSAGGDIEPRPGSLWRPDRFHIEVLGTAAHAAEPHLGVDAIGHRLRDTVPLVRSSGGRSTLRARLRLGRLLPDLWKRYNGCDRAVLDGTVPNHQ